MNIAAPPTEHDAILLDRVAPWAAAGSVSFLRANKPEWCLEVIRHEHPPLNAEDADAVADSALVLELLKLERQGEAPRSRRELLLRAMRRITDALALTREQRAALHREGYAWALTLGRWDEAGVAALDRRFVEMREGMVALLASPCDPASESRWGTLVPLPPGAVIEQARRTIGLHANRLGVFAEAEAILHYFLFRLDTD